MERHCERRAGCAQGRSNPVEHCYSSDGMPGQYVSSAYNLLIRFVSMEAQRPVGEEGPWYIDAAD